MPFRERLVEQRPAVEMEQVEREKRDRAAGPALEAGVHRPRIGATGRVDDHQLPVEHRRSCVHADGEPGQLAQVSGEVRAVLAGDADSPSPRHLGRPDVDERAPPAPPRLEQVLVGIERLGQRPRQHRPKLGQRGQDRPLRFEPERKLVGHRRPMVARSACSERTETRVYPHRPMVTSHRSDSLARERANELIRSWDSRPGPLGSLLGRVTPVDQVGVEQRVDALKRRSIKKASKLWALDLAVRMMDLTTLEGKDTPGKVRALCVKGMHPKPGDPTIPSVAAICIYPSLIPEAKEALKGSTVKVASVATGFPSGQTYLDIKLAETRQAVEAGADEIDMVIDRSAFLAGDYAAVFDEIVEVKEAAGEAHLKVILEAGQLETYDNVLRASILAMAAGADFVKTSTGKITPAATMPVTLVMLEAIRDFERATGRQVGMKPAGGIRVAKEAIQYLVVLYETLGPRWMSPDWFRFGASSLLNDVLMQIEWVRTGRYQDPDDYTLD